MSLPKTRCDECPKRSQCEDCRGWDEFRERLVDGLSKKMAEAIVSRSEWRNR